MARKERDGVQTQTHHRNSMSRFRPHTAWPYLPPRTGYKLRPPLKVSCSNKVWTPEVPRLGQTAKRVDGRRPFELFPARGGLCACEVDQRITAPNGQLPGMCELEGTTLSENACEPACHPAKQSLGPPNDGRGHAGHSCLQPHRCVSDFSQSDRSARLLSTFWTRTMGLRPGGLSVIRIEV